MAAEPAAADRYRAVATRSGAPATRRRRTGRRWPCSTTPSSSSTTSSSNGSGSQRFVVEPARAAIAAYVKSVPLLIDPPCDEPPPPPFDGLRSAGVPLRPTAQTDSAILRAAPTRRAVAGVLSHQGWAWPL